MPWFPAGHTHINWSYFQVGPSKTLVFSQSFFVGHPTQWITLQGLREEKGESGVDVLKAEEVLGSEYLLIAMAIL